MRNLVLVAVSSLALAACGMKGQDNEKDADTVASVQESRDYGYDTYGDDNLADSMASNDDLYLNGPGDGSSATIADSEDRPIMQAQVVLDVEKRRPLYYKAEDLLMDEAGIAIMAHMPIYKVFSNKVQGFQYIPADLVNLHTVSLA